MANNKAPKLSAPEAMLVCIPEKIHAKRANGSGTHSFYWL